MWWQGGRRNLEGAKNLAIIEAFNALKRSGKYTLRHKSTLCLLDTVWLEFKCSIGTTLSLGV